MTSNSLDTRLPASHLDPDIGPATEARTARRWPAALVIAGSLAAGAGVALLLTLVVFAGADESVITGSVLVAFGFGWVLVATLTGRLTSQPQRWAMVPAAVMGVTGLVLLALRPGDDGLTAWGWVWPPVALALAARMYVQMRRALAGTGRWLLTPVIAALAVAALGATGENIALLHDHDTYTAPGERYDVGGHLLHLDCRGHGGPTVVLFNGLGEISASWARITEQVAPATRVCAFDRAGQGWSEDSRVPQDGAAAAEDLHTLLATAGEHGPYVLAGHSLGGPYAMTYAARYPEQVAGLVLLDSSSPYQFSEIPGFAGEFALMRRAVAVLPTLARLGAGRVLTPASHLPAHSAGQVEAFGSTARAGRNVRDEQSVLRRVLAQAQALSTLHHRPLAVLTASGSLTTAGWAAAQDHLVDLSDHHVHHVIASTHGGLLEDAHGAHESVRAISEVVSAARARSGGDTE